MYEKPRHEIFIPDDARLANNSSRRRRAQTPSETYLDPASIFRPKPVDSDKLMGNVRSSSVTPQLPYSSACACQYRPCVQRFLRKGPATFLLMSKQENLLARGSKSPCRGETDCSACDLDPLAKSNAHTRVRMHLTSRCLLS